jgi:thioredoxin
MSNEKSATIAITEAEFDATVLASTRPVIVDFWAPWCSPCRFLTPLFEKFAREFGDKALFVKMNRDETPNLRARYEINSIPRLISFENGALSKVEIGLAGYSFQRNRVKKMLGLTTAGRPSKREKEYQKLADAAMGLYEEAVKDTQTALMEAYAPISRKTQTDMEVNDLALGARAITQEEHKARSEEIQAEAEKAQKALQPLVEAYQAASAPAEVLYIAAIQSANDLLFPLTAGTASPATGVQTATASEGAEGAFCAIGDPTCGGTIASPAVKAPEAIYFYNQREVPYGVFGNFPFFTIEIDGVEWKSTEIFFQAKKFEGTPSEIEIKNAETSRLAAEMGRDHSRPLRADWNETKDITALPDATTLSADWEKFVGRPMRVKDYIMLIAVRAKFGRYKNLADLLLATGDALIVEHTVRDDYWADAGDGTGVNMLGKILMIVRAELRRLSA